jgi:hypothetical protein
MLAIAENHREPASAAGEQHSLHNRGGEGMLVLTIYDPPRERPKDQVRY